MLSGMRAFGLDLEEDAGERSQLVEMLRDVARPEKPSSTAARDPNP